MFLICKIIQNTSQNNLEDVGGTARKRHASTVRKMTHDWTASSFTPASRLSSAVCCVDTESTLPAQSGFNASASTHTRCAETAASPRGLRREASPCPRRFRQHVQRLPAEPGDTGIGAPLPHLFWEELH